MKLNGATLTLAAVGALAAAQVARDYGLFVPFPALAVLGTANRAPKAPRGRLVVVLESALGRDGRRTDEVVESEVVSSLREASRAVRRFIERGGLGSSQWTGGDVFDESGERVAQISYNGRAWQPGAWPTPQISMGSADRLAALTSSARTALSDRDFAVIEAQGGMKVRKYPISDRRHAQIALVYVMAPSNARYREQVKRAVFARYPDLRAWWNQTTAKHQSSRRRAA